MHERTVTIANRRGLHARAAAKLVTLSERYDAAVEIQYEAEVVPATSIMGLMLLGAPIGATLRVRARGIEAEAALEAFTGMIESGFQEED